MHREAAQLAAEGEAIAIGQTQIEQHQIEQLALQPAQGLSGGGGHLGGISPLTQKPQQG